MINNVKEFNQKLVATLKERDLPVEISNGYQITQMPYYFNIESKENEYLTFKELVNSIELIVENHPEVVKLDQIMNLFEGFTLFQEINNNETLVSAIIDHDKCAEDPLFGDISNMMWSAFINDELVVEHLKNTKLILFDYNKGIALRLMTL